MSFLKSVRFWIGLLISVVCLWLAFRNVPISQFIDALKSVEPGYLLLAASFQLLAVLARGKRWQSILGGEVRLKTTFFGHGIGFLFNNILPFRAGEVARTIAVADWARQPFFKVGSSVLLERLIDVAVIVLALILVLPFMRVEPAVLQGGLLLGAVALIGLGLLFAAAMRPMWGRKILSWILQRIPRLPVERSLVWFDQLIDGVRVMASVSQIMQVLFWSLISWVCSVLLYFSVFKSFQPLTTWLEATFVVVALSLSISIPSSPGFLGVFQYVGLQALVLPFGDKYDPATALAAIMVAYLVYYLGTSLIGVISLQGFSSSLSSLQERLATIRSETLSNQQEKI
jgi:uncharacterized protein (TIRG00374 family)